MEIKFKKLTSSSKAPDKIRVLSLEFVSFFALLVLLGFVGYHKAFSLDYWADDWIFVYLAKYELAGYVHKLLYGLHPGELFIGIPFISLFGTNVIAWNVWGFVLKLVSSLAVGMALYGVTQKKIAFYLSSLLFVTFFAGIDSYTVMSWRTVPYTVILLSLSMYYFSRHLQVKIEKFFWLSIILSLVAIVFDPMRIFPFPFLLLIWEAGDRYAENGFKAVFSSKVFSLLGISLASFGATLVWFSNRISTPSERIDYILTNSNLWKSFVSSLESLITAYGVAIPSKLFVSGFILVLFTGLILTLRRVKSGPLIIIFALFIPVFFFPNWSFSIGEYPVTFRYMALPGLGLVFLLSYLLMSLRPKIVIFVVLSCILSMNIAISNAYITKDLANRDIDFTRPYFEKQVEDIPEGQIAGMFYIDGEPGVRSRVFDGSSQGALPYALLKQIPNIELIPYSVVNFEEAQRAICPATSDKFVKQRYLLTEFPIPISKVYGWHIEENGKLTDISLSLRSKLMGETNCKWQID